MWGITGWPTPSSAQHKSAWYQHTTAGTLYFSRVDLRAESLSSLWAKLPISKPISVIFVQNESTWIPLNNKIQVEMCWSSPLRLNRTKRSQGRPETTQMSLQPHADVPQRNFLFVRSPTGLLVSRVIKDRMFMNWGPNIFLQALYPNWETVTILNGSCKWFLRVWGTILNVSLMVPTRAFTVGPLSGLSLGYCYFFSELIFILSVVNYDWLIPTLYCTWQCPLSVQKSQEPIASEGAIA